MTLDDVITRAGGDIEIRPSQFLAGVKKAVLHGRILCVSRALMLLLKGASPAELQELARSIEIVTIPHAEYAWSPPEAI